MARLPQPALFLHFVLTFRRNATCPQVYWIIPRFMSLMLFLGRTFRARVLKASERLRWNSTGCRWLPGAVLREGGVLWYSYRRASTPILGQQLRVTRGTILPSRPSPCST
jgi:hypothetical protein